MKKIWLKRESPVCFGVEALEKQIRQGWEVVLTYAEEGEGPHLVDLSHKGRWDLQDADLSRFRPVDVDIPRLPGACTLKDGVVASRMNRTQASIWHLGAGSPPPPPPLSAYTDVTEATAFLSISGPGVFSILEKATALDFFYSPRKPPFLLQGPLCRVPCQIVTMARKSNEGTILFTCARGFARDMVENLLAAGDEFGLRPAGENRFFNAPGIVGQVKAGVRPSP